jgi:hypothetical protein
MDEKFELDDPETLLSMILSDKIEIITADVEGIANFSANNESLETDKQSPVISSTVWNTAVDSIFLPSTTPKENVQPKKSKAKTTHRLLTADDVLAEKRELLKRKEQKQLKSLRKTKKEK